MPSITYTTPGAITFDNTVYNAATIDVECWGGGGGGAAGNTAFSYGGGGGGGGYCKKSGLAVGAQTYNGVVGDKGIGAATLADGTAGTNSTFTVGATTYTARGGFEGTRFSGRADGGTASNGDVNYRGGDSSSDGPGAGSSAGTGAVGQYQSGAAGGATGGTAPTGGGNGGDGTIGATPAEVGSAPGGGGGGGDNTPVHPLFSIGADGAVGKIVITYYPIDPPVNTVAPAVTGTSQVGQTLSTTNGTWTNTPSSYAYMWKHGDGSAASATATNSTYVCAAGDVGFGMKCEVTASNAGGSTAADSNTTSNVLSAASANPNPLLMMGVG